MRASKMKMTEHEKKLEKMMKELRTLRENKNQAS